MGKEKVNRLPYPGDGSTHISEAVQVRIGQQDSRVPGFEGSGIRAERIRYRRRIGFRVTAFSVANGRLDGPVTWTMMSNWTARRRLLRRSAEHVSLPDFCIS